MNTKDSTEVATHTPGQWELNTLQGRLPAVREIRMPHGEASTFVSLIVTTKGTENCDIANAASVAIAKAEGAK